MTMASKPKVTMYTADISICSQICRIGVHEHGLVDAENVNVDIEYAMENYEPWFVRIQPKMTVPVLRYDDHIIRDSKDILFFLVEQHPSEGLYPAQNKEQVDRYVEGFYARFGQIGAFTFGHLVRRSPELRDFVNHGKRDVTLEKLEALAQRDEFKELATARLEAMKGRDLVGFVESLDLRRLDAFMKVWLDQMDADLADGRPFLAGEQYTLADVVGTAYCARVHFVVGERLFSERVSNYWASMKGRPSFASANVCSVWEDVLMSKQLEQFVAAREG